MHFKLTEINGRIRADAPGFAEECESAFDGKIMLAAQAVAENTRRSPIVLLSGPSGSGKTTTAKRIEDALETLGIRSHSVSLDDYFLPQRENAFPRAPDGTPDFESPMCIDWPLLNEHFDVLSRGGEVILPRFSFAAQGRVAPRRGPLRLGRGEIVIFEGIHALNTLVTDTHPDAFKLYISARSDTADDNGVIVFKGTWTRLVRRAIRDSLFRATDAPATLAMWANIRRGEKAHISPFKGSADLILDTAIAYEIPALRELAARALSVIP
ncbi:MAG: nucleoside kinase, partial [Oscillospiraceae bacterium]|nr:nucleoside kinase [Oscillospiraceae bacterium]